MLYFTTSCCLLWCYVLLLDVIIFYYLTPFIMIYYLMLFIMSYILLLDVIHFVPILCMTTWCYVLLLDVMYDYLMLCMTTCMTDYSEGPINPKPTACIICHITSVDSVAPDQSVHFDLRAINSLLFPKINLHWLISRQYSSQIRLLSTRSRKRVETFSSSQRCASMH